jgi:hypothetical protein
MRTTAIMKSQTPFPVAPYLIATRSYNLRRILIALGAVIAEMVFSGLPSFATCLHIVLVAVDTLFPDPADRFLDVGDAD